MMFTRSLKRIVAQVSIAAVLFTQLAVAAYACPVMTGPANVIAATIVDDTHAGMPGCEMPDAGNPNLCLQHCQAGNQSVQTLPHVEVPAFAAFPTPALIEPAPLEADPPVVTLAALPLHETSPPPLIRFGVLRI